ncbi:uncharacterized protein DEA37_0003547 [Paragonimus westermani]|uniref:Uncharacterized protein n=1 Tax=Paragonimus westermani TaxID=34504 RepID=A0A5J4NDL5_9TREM|nr:uncharacterized protein DEA37_0003547 [Paragonimus westermani]
MGSLLTIFFHPIPCVNVVCLCGHIKFALNCLRVQPPHVFSHSPVDSQMRFLGHVVPLVLIIGLPLVCGQPGDRIKLNSPEQTPFQSKEVHEGDLSAKPEPLKQ